ncbi:DUF3823 domain-containing protein [Parabacteroides sp. GYB001]|uniref:DUF3823 domain-containing protein n=1 Tax=Parabacteroides leei TaxID=2939491 RepID=UPI0020172AC9|nr:DUF3823 domain-containing protein [Parabacteroides leei]MCL3853843.1 DUF3823 domain-containing protein [Parabacteroides leei]
MKKNLLMCMLFVLGMMSCGDIDNMEGPNAAIAGSLIDETTNKPIISEQPNGFRIKMVETSWSESATPEYFWGKADGTFKNTKIFSATYDVQPVEGAFFPVEPVSVTIKKSENIDFKVTPYLAIHPKKVEIAGDAIEVEWTISRPKVGDKILDTRVFVVHDNLNVGTNYFTTALSPMIDLSSVPDEEALSTTYKQTITGLTKGKTYYVKIGARTDNSSKRYNFAETVKLEY